jgi:ribosomal protein S18 acetylase RimI-like enzyme
MEMVEAGLAMFADEGLKHLTVLVERDNAIGRRFYRRMGFAELRELSQEGQGYLLELVECRRFIP